MGLSPRVKKSVVGISTGKFALGVGHFNQKNLGE
jgi:hypothetical protein